MEAPPSTPSLFSGKGTGSATIDMGIEAGRTELHSGAWKKRLGDRRGVLAVKGAVRRCGMDGLIARASFAEHPGAVRGQPTATRFRRQAEIAPDSPGDAQLQ